MSGLWYVKLPDGDVEPLTLDELDEAFQGGHVNANTMVLAAGSTQWARLGELAGLDQPAPRQAMPPPRQAPAAYAMPAPLPVQAYAPVPRSLRPVSVDLSEFDDDISFQPPKKSKKWMFGVVLVAGVLGFAGFEAQQSGVVSISRLMSGASPASAAAVATAPATIAPPAAPSPDPAPAPAPAAPAPAASDNRFTQDQKDKLAAADKMRDTKMKLHAKARAAAVSVHTSASHTKAQGFIMGGSKGDPLSATIP
jgi:hypothetical protein